MTALPRKSTFAIVAGALALGLMPDRVVEPVDWAKEHFYVPDGPRAGSLWDPKETPYAVEILNALGTEDPTNKVVVRKSAQTGLTTVGIAWLGYIADVAPADCLAIQPTSDALREFNRRKLQPAIEGSPAMAAAIRDTKARSGEGSTGTFKRFAKGGGLSLAIGNSAASLRSMTVKYAFADEVDEWPLDLDGQGDPMAMVEARQTAFLNTADWKRYEISTPTTEGESRIDGEFEGGDQRYWHVSCPHCGHEQALVFDRLKGNDEPPFKTHYVCEANGCIIEGRDKRRLIKSGRWIATKPGPGRWRSYHIDEISSPFVPWDEVWSKWIAARKNPALMKTFWNLTLGRAYKTEGDAPEWEALQRRAVTDASHALEELPAWVLFVTYGVDVQGDRLEVGVWGWGVGRTRALITQQVFPGNTADFSVWSELAAFWRRDWTRADGRVMQAEACVVDSGYRPAMAYQWVAGINHPHVVAGKGASERTEWPLKRGTPRNFEDRRTGKRKKVDGYLFGSWYLKAAFYAALNVEGPSEEGRYPPGYVFLPTGGDDELFKQLTAEALVKVPNRRGYEVLQWQKRLNQANEALDCAVMAHAAAVLLGMHLWDVKRWETLAEERGAPPEQGQLDLLRDAMAPRTPSKEQQARRAESLDDMKRRFARLNQG